MLAYQLICDRCAQVIENNTDDDISPRLFNRLQKLREEHDTGKELLCTNCLDEHNKRLLEEDRYQTEDL